MPQGISHADALIGHVEAPDTLLPDSARTVLAALVGTYRALDVQVGELDAEIARRAKADPGWTTYAFECGHNVARLQPEATAEVLLAQV